MKRIAALLLLTCVSLHADIPEPYKSVEDLPFDGHGWFLSASALEDRIRERPVKVVIEVGSWLGGSTRLIASTLPEDGVVYAVDTWRGTTTETETMRDPRIPYLYQLFLSNVKHANLTHKIVPVRMESLEAARALNVMADLIFIDASHDTIAVYNDIMAWYVHLNKDGCMCGDDYPADSVRLGVEQAAKKLGREILSDGRLWWFK
jgi:hypothetical protein